MRFNVNINQDKCKKHGLTAAEGALMDCLNQLSSWANDEVIEGKTFYHISRNKVIDELPFFFMKPDTVYRAFKSLSEKNLIEYQSLKRKDFVRLSRLGKGWNKLGNISDLQANSEINPSKLGNISGFQNSASSPVNPQNLPSNSEINPTDNNNTTNNNSEGTIFSKIKIDNPILFESIFSSETFQLRILTALKSENLKSDFQKDVLPVLKLWIKNRWTANDLNRPANRLVSEATSYVISVIKNGGLKEKEAELKPVYRRKIS